MKKRWQKGIVCLLCAALLAVPLSLPAAAAEKPGNAAVSFLYDLGDTVVKGLIQGISLLIPDVKTPRCFPALEDYYPGMKSFAALPAKPKYNTWKLGFAEASLTDAFTEKDISGFYVSGSLDVIGKRKVSELYDPPMLRATALSDGSGRGTVLLLSVDAFGLTSTDVQKLRAALRDCAADNNVISINVSALHQHSVVDTLGMNGNLLAGLFANSWIRLGSCFNPISGKDAAYMDNLFATAAAVSKKALNAMKPGELFYGKADIADYIHDKRQPEVYDRYAHRLRFVPKDGSKETWLCNFAIHCASIGAGGTRVTGDFPAYTAKEINKAARANFQLIQGAQLAITLDRSEHWPQEEDNFRYMEAFGRNLAGEIMGIAKETRLPALLNIAHRQLTLPIDNPLHLLLMRLGIIESTVRRTNLLFTKGEGLTEIGYMELGGKLAIALVPGELEPALAYGYGPDGFPAEEAYQGWEYEFTSLRKMAGRELIVFGLTNDQIGYILLPNDIYHFVQFGNEEINASSKAAANLFLEAFDALIDSVKP